MIKFYLILAFLASTFNKSEACTCTDENCFMHELTGNELILKVKVVMQDTLPLKLMSDERFRLRYPDYDVKVKGRLPTYPNNFHGYTMLVVEEVISGNLASDTILFLNGYGGRCMATMKGMSIGSEVILKISSKETDELKEIEKLKDHSPFIFMYPSYSASDCSQWHLYMYGNKVQGFISRQDKFELLKRSRTEVDLTDDQRMELLNQMQAIQQEVYSLEEFKEMVADRIANLNK